MSTPSAKAHDIIIGALQLSFGWIFLWPFLDKLFGLGFATVAENAWLAGTSPTQGFLTFATRGPLAPLFQSMAGNVFVDLLFMSGLLLIGLALIFGVMVRPASFFGIVLLLLMYAAVLPPEHNPVIDDHIIYSLGLAVLMAHPARMIFGKRWQNARIVKTYSWLR